LRWKVSEGHQRGAILLNPLRGTATNGKEGPAHTEKKRENKVIICGREKNCTQKVGNTKQKIDLERAEGHQKEKRGGPPHSFVRTIHDPRSK